MGRGFVSRRETRQGKRVALGPSCFELRLAERTIRRSPIVLRKCDKHVNRGERAAFSASRAPGRIAPRTLAEKRGQPASAPRWRGAATFYFPSFRRKKRGMGKQSRHGSGGGGKKKGPGVGEGTEGKRGMGIKSGEGRPGELEPARRAWGRMS